LGFEDITKLEFWEETPEAQEAGVKMGLAFVSIWLYPTNPEYVIAQSAKFGAAAAEYGKATSKITQNPPLITYNTAIPYGESRTLDLLDPEKSYVVYINGKVLSSVSVKDKGDTVYVYDGKLMTEER
jgi:hypothetical protein